MKEKVYEYYRPLLKHYTSDDTRIVSWRNQGNQHLRFFQMIDNIDFNFMDVLDVGCGVGDFYEYIKKEHIKCNYKGIDILDEMINGAKEKYPDIKDKFECVDVLDYFEDTDWVLCNGAFNSKLFDDSSEQNAFMYNILTKFYGISKKGFAINFLSDHTPDELKTNELHYYQAELMYTFCKMNFRHVRLIADYVDDMQEDDVTLIVTK